MVEAQQLSAARRQTIQRQFRGAYGLLVVSFSTIAIAAVAWHWSLPKSYALGLPFGQAALILLGAAILINGLSFLIQDRYVRRLLRQPNITTQFSPLKFALRFYGYNLAVAIAFSLLGFYPWLVLVFFFAHYPIIFWLLPYHLLMGGVLGGWLQRQFATP